ncbi:Succinate-semialdehyde dehydrogenase, mitochondrial [Strongyloides ratti]|uniref:Succinate-semialdehyde dehydrogenase, mitochondrial n=1 Tax=Strongyloides ratti TaxID=34506 RepID=A0A090LQ35_STRRB|nr:Succinate-semialdehyde dehydrogenase, mitochondrial [Strongyloides ratti]CEF69656.1 Succinate-semialdehyde dehydrogenase, mitochondrial [Strongyloides ratti]
MNRQLLGNFKRFSINGKRFYETILLPKGARAFINGEWMKSISGKTFPVLDPYTRETIYEASNCSISEAQIAVEASKQAFTSWSSQFTAKQRGAILSEWGKLLMINQNALAELMTREQGKPLAEAKGEIAYAASYLDFYAAEALRVYGQVVPPNNLNRSHIHVKEPIGVVAVITPWNFPTAMIARKAAAALAVGCTMVVKPAEDTPLSALAFAELGEQSGIPNGVFNVIPADLDNTKEISKYLCSSKSISAISFTGSTEVGKLLLEQSASTVKRVCLELGGNAPFIVFESANIEKAVDGIMASKFRCSGQTCVSANRILINEKIHDEFVEKLTRQIQKLKVGYGLDEGINFGPLINDKAIEKVSRLVKDAKDKGATIQLGGQVAYEGTTLFSPTLIVGVTKDMSIAHEEIFGPVVAVQKFSTEEEAIETANSTRSGLASYFYSQDISQIFRVQKALQFGMVGVNEGLISCSEAAFGGVKESGMGREGGTQGIDEFTQWKYICQTF